MKHSTAAVLAVLLLILVFPFSALSEEEKIPVKVLLLPKFETGELSRDFPGEAQYFYETYLDGADSYEIRGGYAGSRLYVRDGVAMYVTGMGKVNASMSLSALLFDSRFDFSQAYIISTGCAGAGIEYGVMGDVFVISACIDYDLGHHVDIRDLTGSDTVTWYHDPAYDSSSYKLLNQELVQKVYDLVKDVKLETTEKTRSYMAHAFDNAAWAIRDPQVLRGTTITGDNYWKGQHGHRNAVQMTKTYGPPDPYALAEMEDVALAVVMDRMDMLDHFLIIRDAVNMDVFMRGMTPALLWGNDHPADSLATESSEEAADIFATAMKNCFVVTKIVIDAILNGEL